MAVPTPKKKDLINLNGTLLQAIQKIPGDTKAKKHEYLIQKSNAITESSASLNSVPAAFHPFINAEIAKKTGKLELIIDALKSSDDTVIAHLLNIDNLFVAENSPLLQFDYFYSEIQADVSLSTRKKIIKKAASDLTRNDSKIAHEFFSGFLKKYGIDSAIPLLLACDEEFIHEQIMKYRIIFHKGFLKKLFKRYPEVVIKYLKLGIPSKSEQPLRLPNVKIETYLAFLPCLVSHHFEDFVQLCSALSPLKEKLLSKRKSREFFKKGMADLKKNPKLFLSIVDLEAATKHIKFEDFQAIVRELLPKNLKDFYGKEILPYLQHFSDARKVLFITSIFKDAYGAELYDHPYLISKKLLSMIPTQDRIKITKCNEEKYPSSYPDNKNYYYYCEDLFSTSDMSINWYCFLPTKETIPEIKNEISKNSRERSRQELVSEIFYTCKINNDNEALLDTLAYLKERHKNESLVFFKGVFKSFIAVFASSPLNVDCCKALNAIMGYIIIKHEHRELDFLLPVMEYVISQKLDHQSIIDDDIKLMIQIMNATGNRQCSILQSKPAHNRICLEKFLNLISVDLEPNAKKFLMPLLSSVHNFNESNKNKKSVVPIDIRNNENTMKCIKDSLQDEELGQDLKSLLEEKFFDAFDTIFKNKPGRYNIHGKRIINTLKENPSEIIQDWESYYNQTAKCQRNLPVRFLKSIKWYKDIPMNFAERCLQDLADGKSSSLGIIGYLLEGPDFAKVFNATIPKDLSFNRMEHKDAETLQRAIFEALRATSESNPPVPLDMFKKVVTEDFTVDAIKFFYSVAQRTAVSKVADFAEDLLKIERVSVKRHGIRLACAMLTSEEKSSFLERCLKSEHHQSIQSLALMELYEAFVQNPNEDTFKCFETSLQNYYVDDEKLKQTIANLKQVPNAYVTSYIKTVLSVAPKDEDHAYSIIRQIDISYKEVLPEEFQLYLIKTAVFCYAAETEVYNIDFIFDVYLSGPGLDSKLSAFIDLLVSFVLENPHLPDNPFEYRGRNFLCGVVRNYAKLTCKRPLKTTPITKALKKAVESVLTPQDHAESYTMLFLTENFEEANGSFKKFGKITGEGMESIMEVLGREFISGIIAFFCDFLHLFRKSHELEHSIPTDIIHGLLEVNTVGSYVLAAQLCISYEKETEECKKIFEKLHSSQFPAVKSILSEVFHGNGFLYD